MSSLLQQTVSNLCPYHVKKATPPFFQFLIYRFNRRVFSYLSTNSQFFFSYNLFVFKTLAIFLSFTCTLSIISIHDHNCLFFFYVLFFQYCFSSSPFSFFFFKKNINQHIRFITLCLTTVSTVLYCVLSVVYTPLTSKQFQYKHTVLRIPAVRKHAVL